MFFSAHHLGSGPCWSLLFCFHFVIITWKYTVTDFRGRCMCVGGWGRERNINQWPRLHSPTGDGTGNLSMYEALLQSTELHQPGPVSFFIPPSFLLCPKRTFGSSRLLSLSHWDKSYSPTGRKMLRWSLMICLHQSLSTLCAVLIYILWVG